MLRTAVHVIETYEVGQFVAHLVTAPTSHTKFKNFVARDSCKNASPTLTAIPPKENKRSIANQLHEQAIPDCKSLVR